MLSKVRFSRYAMGLLVYTLLVILWGAWVRISHSGDGCGESWPLCHGQVIPEKLDLPTWTEFGHRLSSGLYGFAVIFLVVLAFRQFPKGHPARKVSLTTLFFTVSEALLGAGLVLKGLVGGNESVERAYVMALHMFNSLLLTGSLAAVYALSLPWRPLPFRDIRKKWVGGFLLLGFIVISSTGAIAALAGTLFPAQTLLHGLLQDLSHDPHFLVRLRVWHPVAATVIGAAILFFSISIYYGGYPDFLRDKAKRLLIAVLIGIAFGYMTLFALSPTWMKLAHLLLAHLIWVHLVWLVQPVFRS